MTLIFIIAFALLVLAVVMLAVRRNPAPLKDINEIEGLTCAVDLAAFENLISAGEEQFLRQRLPARDFRQVQRARMWAALDYVRRIASNAAALIRMGEMARLAADPDVVNIGNSLVEDGLRLRMLALRAQVKLYAEILLPNLNLEAFGFDLANRYARLRESATVITHLHTPDALGRVRASL